jgi:hypothetical protein
MVLPPATCSPELPTTPAPTPRFATFNSDLLVEWVVQLPHSSALEWLQKTLSAATTSSTELPTVSAIAIPLLLAAEPAQESPM